MCPQNDILFPELTVSKKHVLFFQYVSYNIPLVLFNADNKCLFLLHATWILHATEVLD